MADASVPVGGDGDDALWLQTDARETHPVGVKLEPGPGTAAAAFGAAAFRNQFAGGKLLNGAGYHGVVASGEPRQFHP
ncbi:hypothetical protein SDC9_147947 [bioreactor metagenome]|uniref:Uncharacterized protein n=1 Tax=bioreactor metagenome TaxID=1076179 RepID=A0A645EFS0_9ZZZZ